MNKKTHNSIPNSFNSWPHFMFFIDLPDQDLLKLTVSLCCIGAQKPQHKGPCTSARLIKLVWMTVSDFLCVSLSGWDNECILYSLSFMRSRIHYVVDSQLLDLWWHYYSFRLPNQYKKGRPSLPYLSDHLSILSFSHHHTANSPTHTPPLTTITTIITITSREASTVDQPYKQKPLCSFSSFAGFVGL